MPNENVTLTKAVLHQESMWEMELFIFPLTAHSKRHSRDVVSVSDGIDK